MQIGILKTDGGPHSAADWARVTVSQIIDIASSAPKALIADARELEAKLVELLTRFHQDVQDHERAGLDKDGSDRLNTEIDTDPHHSDAVDAVTAAAKGTSFEGHFKKPEVQEYLVSVLNNHFHTSILCERSWHADRNPDHEESIAFRDRITNGPVAGNIPAKSIKRNT